MVKYLKRLNNKFKLWLMKRSSNPVIRKYSLDEVTGIIGELKYGRRDINKLIHYKRMFYNNLFDKTVSKVRNPKLDPTRAKIMRMLSNRRKANMISDDAFLIRDIYEIEDTTSMLIYIIDLLDFYDKFKRVATFNDITNTIYPNGFYSKETVKDIDKYILGITSTENILVSPCSIRNIDFIRNTGVCMFSLTKLKIATNRFIENTF